MFGLLRILLSVLTLGLADEAIAQTVEYIHTDALGSIFTVTDANGNIIERREYEPYGSQLSPTVQDGPGYTGHVQDSATGLIYMQQRYYDSAIGAMLSVDPVTAYENPVTNFCRYCYARNNPYRFMDPDGRQTIPTENKIGTDNPATIQAFHEAQGESALKFLEVAGKMFLSQFSDGPGGAAAGVGTMARGVASEARVLDALGEVKNTEKVVTSQGKTIPDFQNARQVGEIKDAKKVSDTTQIRAQREHAQATGREHTLITRAYFNNRKKYTSQQEC